VAEAGFMRAGKQTTEQGASCLGHAPRGFRGRIHAISVPDGISHLPLGELERRLIELGFIEGATVEILHEGIFGRDPIAVRVNHATVALRRREAMAILVS
jgi:ferrous iron transport protein A